MKAFLKLVEGVEAGAKFLMQDLPRRQGASTYEDINTDIAEAAKATFINPLAKPFSGARTTVMENVEAVASGPVKGPVLGTKMAGAAIGSIFVGQHATQFPKITERTKKLVWYLYKDIEDRLKDGKISAEEYLKLRTAAQKQFKVFQDPHTGLYMSEMDSSGFRVSTAIPKKALEISITGKAATANLKDVAKFDEFKANYPSIWERLKLTLDPTMKSQGLLDVYKTGGVVGYEVRVNPDQLGAGWNKFKDTVIHELNHAIQHVEGFKGGGSPSLARKIIEEALQRPAHTRAKYQQKIAKLASEGVYQENYQWTAADIKKHKDSLDMVANQVYLRMPGEYLSRAGQATHLNPALKDVRHALDRPEMSGSRLTYKDTINIPGLHAEDWRMRGIDPEQFLK